MIRCPMSRITIRNLDPGLRNGCPFAPPSGRSMEAEALRILKTALATARSPSRNLCERVRAHFAPLGGVELELPLRETTREPSRFD